MSQALLACRPGLGVAPVLAFFKRGACFCCELGQEGDQAKSLMVEPRQLDLHLPRLIG